MTTEEKIVIEKMYNNDPFSQWLGISVVKISKGYAELEMTVRPEMCNGFGIAHGGITYSLADSALAFASNSLGIQALSIETSINHLKPLKSGNKIIAITKAINDTSKTTLFTIDIFRGNDKVAFFKGMVYKTGKKWLTDDKDGLD